MPPKTPAQLIDALKKKLGSVPQNLEDYVKKGDEYFAQGNFDVAAGIYNLAAEVAPSGHPANKKRYEAIKKWLAACRTLFKFHSFF